ncbi:MAG: hypothetical protein A2Y79_13060 [Deltaproteobacteria bacterium RBG_13_43_22]|nr:MAG: hypothetical protein A2Y79_13060 [Deltaproteobacteria bacterium RBG_13_43_22]
MFSIAFQWVLMVKRKETITVEGISVAKGPVTIVSEIWVLTLGTKILIRKRKQVLKNRINMPSLITLEGEMTLDNLERLHEQLQTALLDQGDVILSCSRLEYLDTAAFQLLVSLKKSLKKRSLVFQDVPLAVIETGDLLGLNTFLKLGG